MPMGPVGSINAHHSHNTCLVLHTYCMLTTTSSYAHGPALPTAAAPKRSIHADGSKPGAVVVVATWRRRMHEARRRVCIVVMVCIRLKAGLKHPKRLRRVDSFSFYIHTVLQVRRGLICNASARAARCHCLLLSAGLSIHSAARAACPRVA